MIRTKLRKLKKLFNMYGFIGFIRHKLESGKSVGWKGKEYQCSEIKSYLPKDAICLNFLGSGKDSIVFTIEREGVIWVFKVLSDYGKSFLNRMKYFSENTDQISKHLYQINVTDSFYTYKYEDLYDAPTNSVGLLNVVGQICNLQVELIRVDLVYWDFGSTMQNYMLTKNGTLKIIDYGGNAYIRINSNNNVNTYRESLLSPRSDFIRCQLFLHLIVFGLGDLKAKELMISTQFAKKSLIFALKWIENRVKGTGFELFFLQSIDIDFLDVNGWEKFHKNINNINVDDLNAPLEEADIERVDFLENCVNVKGYQSYKVCSDGFSTYKTNDLWDTKIKSAKVLEAIQYALESRTIESMQDVGCNLGLYVFLCSQQLKIRSCSGYDYNKKYIHTCNEIKSHLNISNTSFKYKSFSDLSKETDLFLCLGLIHHLFHRTEDWGDLNAIVKHMRSLTKSVLIVEFPTSDDPKAEKWTNLPGRSEASKYSVANFEASLSRHFTSYKIINKIAETRVVYVAFC
jgi:hypothetical protein